MNLKNIAAKIKKIASGKKKVVVIVQCRMSSTRLPGKALMPLGGKTVLEWTLASMKKIQASKYYLAVDEASKEALEPVAKKCGWDFYAGSLEDVLDRFCNVIKISKADVVVRATADNPFLFYEAAQEMVDEFFERENSDPSDYLTYSGLPHGSGVEMFNAHSLLKAAEETEDPYDHEHVGPALYNHTDRYKCDFIKAPAKYNHPEYRTTIDTKEDYHKALEIVEEISGQDPVVEPYTTEEILKALEIPAVKNPVLLVPSVKKGQGTGHLRRCLSLALENKWDVYIPTDEDLAQAKELVKDAESKGLEKYHIIDNLDELSYYSVVITDLFRTDDIMALKLSAKATVIALDEGNENNDYADFVLDVLPSANHNRIVNVSAPHLIPRPEKKRSVEQKSTALRNALVVLGGEDPSGLTLPAVIALSQNDVYVTAIVPNSSEQEKLEKKLPEHLRKFVKFSLPVENLKEKLFNYDLVVTHYGFTAFEAASANCAVILLGTTPLHVELSESYGFKCLAPSQITGSKVKELLEEKDSLYMEEQVEEIESLAQYVERLSSGNHFMCPVCQKNDVSKNKVVSRIPERTFRRCNDCGMIYIGWTVKEKQTEYNRAYFFEDYEKQYGKTYLDDFESIKSQCVRRIGQIDLLYRHSGHRFGKSVTPSVLDIGCAMGPFLSAANDSGWQVFGADISQDAVDYVQKDLKFPAVCAPFPDGNFENEFGVEKFDAVTMWYVIEHFQNLDAVLKKVSELVKKGGIFAFSTPSGSGVSARFNTKTFFEQSPSDHFSIWELNRVKSILSRYGFEVHRITSTGIHPERFPFAKKKGLLPGSLGFKLLASYSRMFKLGDTCEIYCIKK
ncbi:cytidylyltransferase domain-containing protein [Treponema sp.]|uniref:cytidylyltransferase domain-containing protein n=1 Tax=Treponema sp. TaxID=166 RepID=UPI00298D958B|nr:methyltransferase domain-containing protein [Treponema sp.]MCQ2241836.1 methyltransferase domain-containing protein [Treponema sp.]